MSHSEFFSPLNFCVLFVFSDMTEEEMLALAMRLSAQEANSAAHREELEDSDIQKAIAESLNVGETFSERLECTT